jgi:hypothetical protein
MATKPQGCKHKDDCTHKNRLCVNDSYSHKKCIYYDNPDARKRGLVEVTHDYKI